MTAGEHSPPQRLGTSNRMNIREASMARSTMRDRVRRASLCQIMLLGCCCCLCTLNFHNNTDIHTRSTNPNKQREQRRLKLNLLLNDKNTVILTHFPLHIVPYFHLFRMSCITVHSFALVLTLFCRGVFPPFLGRGHTIKRIYGGEWPANEQVLFAHFCSFWSKNNQLFKYS